MPISSAQQDTLVRALDAFRIELPSWAFADTGTRFGKFTQAAAASTFEEKARRCRTGASLHGLLPDGRDPCALGFPERRERCRRGAARGRFDMACAIGSISPNIFQDQEYKHGSLGNPGSGDPRARRCSTFSIASRSPRRAAAAMLRPGSPMGRIIRARPNIRHRRAWFQEGLKRVHDALAAQVSGMLIEYKPFEPAFYHTDIADWGMSYLLAKSSGRKAKVLVDTGHHYQAQNIEQIVAWLLQDDMLGGFHFNDRRYADDDLTLGSIDPYQVFRIFHEIHFFAWETGTHAGHRLHGGPES